MQDESKNKPTKIFRCGPVETAIWVDHRVIDNAVVKLHSIRITKNYRQDNEWKSTTTFTAEDLPKVAMVATEAYRFLRLRSEEPADFVGYRRTAEDTDVDGGAETHPAGYRTPQSRQGQGPEKES